ncbi:MAG: hypothetical protein Q4F57_07850 [Weeksellaceae bacterium]|nr:hypothetical protein [Weeksellaceae bacterium]
MTRISLALFGALIALSACVTPLNRKKTQEQLAANMSAESKALRAGTAFKSCKPEEMARLGDTVLFNNVWGASKITQGELRQCIFHNQPQARGKMGWEWEVPHNARGVIAYPSVIVGHSPWVQTSSHQLPRLWEELFMIDVVYEAEMQVRGRKYNLAFDLWLTHTSLPTEKDIAYEIMVWEDHYDFRSHGRRVGSVETPFGDYWLHVGHMKRPELNTEWKYLAFVRKQRRQSGFVDLKFLLDYAVEKGHLTPGLYLSALEFGNEVGNSSGITVLRQFDVSIM